MAEMKRHLSISVLMLVIILLSACSGGVAKPTQYTPPSVPSPSHSLTQSPTKAPEKPKSITLNPLTLSELPNEIKEASPSPDLYTRHFIWEYADITWNWDMKISEALFRYYKAIPRAKTDNYSIYVTYKQDDAMMKEAAQEILRAAQSVNLNRLETAELTATFVQSLMYTEDIKTTGFEEYPRYPVETLVDNCGDCEDKSALLASLLEGMGFKAVLIIFPGIHGAVGIQKTEDMKGAYYEYNGANYYYIETTDSGWRVGEIPDQYARLSPTFLEIKPVPVLVHEFTASGTGTQLKVDVDVENLGTEDAKEVVVSVGFDGGDGKVINAKESSKFSLLQNQKNSVSLYLQSPPGKHTRLVIEVKAGTESAKSYSEWFDTP